ncbi:hypothetical protein B0H13DRAFT_2665877 [Mycena leptocephala]|nr:hypothetical protein B0H13DRAFT_2665877 [Mycena leptocephala]
MGLDWKAGVREWLISLGLRPSNYLDHLNAIDPCGICIILASLLLQLIPLPRLLEVYSFIAYAHDYLSAFAHDSQSAYAHDSPSAKDFHDQKRMRIKDFDLGLLRRPDYDALKHGELDSDSESDNDMDVDTSNDDECGSENIPGQSSTVVDVMDVDEDVGVNALVSLQSKHALKVRSLNMKAIVLLLPFLGWTPIVCLHLYHAMNPGILTLMENLKVFCLIPALDLTTKEKLCFLLVKLVLLPSNREKFLDFLLPIITTLALSLQNYRNSL